MPDYRRAVLLFLIGLLILIIVSGLLDEIGRVPIVRTVVNPILMILAVIAAVFFWFLAFLVAFPPV